MAIILAVPTALLMGLASAGVYAQYQVGRRADATVSDVDLVLAAQDLIHSLQRERGLTSGLLGGAAAYRPQVDAQRRVSDRARAALDRQLTITGGAGARSVRPALGRLGDLGTIRGTVDAGGLSRPRMLDYYTGAIQGLNATLSVITSDGDAGRRDRELGRGLNALQLLGDAKEATALERGHLNGVFAAGSFTQDDYTRFSEVRARKLDALARFPAVASTRRKADLDAALRSPQATAASADEQRALSGARGQRLKVNPSRWWAEMTTVVDDMRTVQRGIGDDVRARARQIAAEARRRLIVYAAGAGLALLVALLLWAYTFRSIMRPLRLLAKEALDSAEHELPVAMARIQEASDPGELVQEAAPGARADLVRRDDEFAEVARALAHLRQTAVRLAVEQAVMRRNTAESLANLGRRNQNLVRRQIGFISALEREEGDPGALANLFELDHLATRMRRNAESLLVLVGEHSPRRWSGTVAVGDVLRSAFAEVEDYRRVSLRRMDEARVRGSVAADISHLLAELVENALTFSPPDREVEVQARATGSEYHIAIVDQGVGMDPAAMATANARLRGEQSFLVAPARDLGHYVVGRLAERLGVQVWLHESPLTGVTARIILPGTLLVPDAEAVAEPAGPRASMPGALRGAALLRGTAEPVTIATGPISVITAPDHAPFTLETPAAAVPPPAGAVPFDTGAPDGRETTRNGLVKRRPRPQAPRPSRGDHGALAADPPRSPDEVRSMLDAFRSGAHRAAPSDPSTETT